MLALVTGASSGIGFEIAKVLSNKGYDIIAVGKNEERLNKLNECCNTRVIVEIVDLNDKEACINLATKYMNNTDILVNSAGVGTIGKFENILLKDELDMININIIALHILTKMFIKSMVEKNYGYVLNISSSAAYAPGPLMSSYYATKSYVYKLSTSINKELRKSKSNVYVGVVCPGPVDTNFNKKLDIKFSVKPTSAKEVAKYSIDKMFNKKQVIVPGIKNKLGVLASKLLPNKILEEYIYNMQREKIRRNV